MLRGLGFRVVGLGLGVLASSAPRQAPPSAFIGRSQSADPAPPDRPLHARAWSCDATALMTSGEGLRSSPSHLPDRPLHPHLPLRVSGLWPLGRNWAVRASCAPRQAPPNSFIGRSQPLREGPACSCATPDHVHGSRVVSEENRSPLHVCSYISL